MASKKRFQIRIGEDFPLEATFESNSETKNKRQQHHNDSLGNHNLRIPVVVGLVIAFLLCCITGLYQWIVTGQFAEFRSVWILIWPLPTAMIAFCFWAKGTRSYERSRS